MFNFADGLKFTDEEYRFNSEVEIKLCQKGINTNFVNVSRRNKALNFEYNRCQFGRFRFDTQACGMQILTKDTVEWLENLTLEEYILKIELWIDYIEKDLLPLCKEME